MGLQRVRHDWATFTYDSHVWMWDLDHKKAECWRIDAFELWCWRRIESSLDWKEIKPVYPKGNQPWIFIGRTDAEAETPILWLPDGKSWLIWKDPYAGKDWAEGEGDNRGWVTDSMDMSLSKLWGTVKDREAWHAAVPGVTKSRTWLGDWTTTKYSF